MQERKTALDRVLSLAAPVRGGEGIAVLLLALNAFILLASYYLLKTVREALILSQGGAEVKSYSAAGQAALLLLVVPLYGAFTSRFGRTRVIVWIDLIFIANLVIFYAVGLAGGREGVVFFIWVGIFNNFAVAQLWSFANDLYSEEQGKRLFPIIGIGTASGAVAGAAIASPFIKASGPYPLMLAAAGALVACLLLTVVVDRRSRSNPQVFKSGDPEVPLAKTGAFELIRNDRYLMLIAILIVVLNIVNTSGEFLLGKYVTAAAVQEVGNDKQAQEKIIGGFYGNFFAAVNITGMLLQAFGVSRIFRYLGLRGALMIPPILALCNYSFLLVMPILSIIRIGKILENGTDYSLMNTTRHALYLATSREAKYKVKSAIDTFFVRAGDMLQGGLVYVGTALAIGTKGFAIVVVALAVVWMGIALALGKENARRSQSMAKAA